MPTARRQLCTGQDNEVELWCGLQGVARGWEPFELKLAPDHRRAMPTTANWQATSWWSRLLTVEQANKGYRCIRRVYIALYSAADLLLPRWLPTSLTAAALLGATCFLGLLNVASATAAALAVLACLAALHAASAADKPGAAQSAHRVSEGTVASINLGSSADFGEGLRRRRRSARSALVTYLGVAGDEQKIDLIKSWGGHGGARKAVMLFSADVIRRVNRDGHRNVAAGTCGEQFTVEGVDWREMRTGAKVEIGSALLEVTYLKAPCSNQASERPIPVVSDVVSADISAYIAT